MIGYKNGQVFCFLLTCLFVDYSRSEEQKKIDLFIKMSLTFFYLHKTKIISTTPFSFLVSSIENRSQ
jgi:hypothetical protein